MAAVLCLSAVLCSCDDSFVYDGASKCVVPDMTAYYRVRFKYDYNMKYGDAFAHEVSTVTLYLIDADGNITWQRTEEGEALAEDGYVMELSTDDIAPGTYDLLVWAGTKDKGTFAISEGTMATDLQCLLRRNHDAEGAPYVDSDLDRLFHGRLEAQEFPSEAGTYTYTVSLTKDTNLFRIALQQVSGGTVDTSKFTFTITDDNGLLDWDNTVIADQEGTMTYYAWNVETGEAEGYMDTEGDTGETAEAEEDDGTRTRAATYVYGAAVAELTTSRLATSNTPRLTVRNQEKDKTVFSIPIKDYLLMMRSSEHREMGDQEFLDRQDEWSMTFFLDEDDNWLASYIYINSWKLVLQNVGL